jgi:hypothetical protein
MIIDLDSHLREGYFLDEVYRLEEPYARYSPVKVGDGREDVFLPVAMVPAGCPDEMAKGGASGRVLRAAELG